MPTHAAMMGETGEPGNRVYRGLDTLNYNNDDDDVSDDNDVQYPVDATGRGTHPSRPPRESFIVSGGLRGAFEGS